MKTSIALLILMVLIGYILYIFPNPVTALMFVLDGVILLSYCTAQTMSLIFE